MKIDLWKTIIGVEGLSHEEGECHVGCICRIDIILAKIGIDGVNSNLATAIHSYDRGLNYGLGHGIFSWSSVWYF